MGINFYLGLREVFCFWIVRVLFLGFGRFGFVLFEIVFSLGTAVFFLIGSKSFQVMLIIGNIEVLFKVMIFVYFRVFEFFYNRIVVNEKVFIQLFRVVKFGLMGKKRLFVQVVWRLFLFFLYGFVWFVFIFYFWQTF